MQQRSFPSGSRPAPDPYDQFLEQNGFYRKHTARDASSLYRVISEQMYDTQTHHLAVRKQCVSYMRKHRKFFQVLVERDLDEYLDDMSKPKTCATLIELQAVGLLYKRNVILFEPFNMGNAFGQHRKDFLEVFRVFCTPEKHFDSVFTSSYIKDAAICQSLCYELLYKDIFKLPDVDFAVEIMLHNTNLDPQQCISEITENAFQSSDKKNFPLDSPKDTNCILEDSRLCSFHSDVDENENSSDGQTALEKPATETLLPNKRMSCVRQLLLEGITPFPYKVAKALDPTMYRNIEFDAWNEERKELKFQSWYCGDSNFKVPYEALSPLPVEQFKPWALPYRLHRQMQKYNSMRLTRHYNYRFKFNGQPSVGSYSKSLGGSLPPICNGMQKGVACPGTGFALDFSDLKHQQQQHYVHLAMPSQHHFHNSYFYNLTHLENFRARTFEYCTMPLTVEHNVNIKCAADSNGDVGGNCGGTLTPTPELTTENLDESNPVATSTVDNGSQEDSPGSREVTLINHNYALEQSNVSYVPEYPTYYPMQSYVGVPEDFYAFGCEPTINSQFSSCPNGGMYYMCNPGAPTAHGYSSVSNNFYLQGPQVQPPPPVLISPTPMAPPQYYSTTNAYFTNSAPATMLPAPLLSQAATVAHTIHESGGNTGVAITTPLSGRINYDAKKSIKLNGMDLPTDMATLRYFYNLGVEAYTRRRHSQDSAIGSRENMNSKEERINEQKDTNTCKNDANNNNLPSNSNIKSNSTHSNPSHLNNHMKPQYGPRRFHNNHNNRYNNVRDRPPQRRNSLSVEEVNSTGVLPINNNNFSHRNYNDYSKNKYQQQNSNDRHSDSNRPNGSTNSLNVNRLHTRNNERIYVDSGANTHNSIISASGDGVPDTTSKGPSSGDQGDNGQGYASFVQPPSSYDHLNDFNPNGAGNAGTPGNMFIPVHMQQTPTMYTTAPPTPLNGAFLQPMNQPTASSSPNYVAPHYFGHPSSPLVQNGFTAPMNGISVPSFYTPSNPLSSNASESSGGGTGNGENTVVSTQPLQPALMTTNNYGPSIPVYVTPNPSNSNPNGQPIMHHTLQPPPPHIHGSGSQGYWCLPPPPPPPPPPTAPAFIPPSPGQVTHIPNLGYVSTVTNNTNHTQVSPTIPSPNNTGGTQNRRTQSQQQPQQQQQQQQQQQLEKETH